MSAVYYTQNQRPEQNPLPAWGFSYSWVTLWEGPRAAYIL